MLIERQIGATFLPLLLLLLVAVGINPFHNQHSAHGFATTTKSNNSNRNNKIQFRRGQKSDELKISSTLVKELMNPVGIQGDRFVVATDVVRGNIIVGWAQIKPLGKPTTTTATTTTAQRDPSRFNARPGSYDLDQEVDEAMWDDFENDDSIQVPVGLASLPWTKEYRAMTKAVQDRDKNRQQLRAQRQQELQVVQLWELSSVYVEPAYRGQGIGTELVRRVLYQHLFGGDQQQQQKKTSSTLPSSVYCLTLATTVDWYKSNFGFETVSSNDIPTPMAFEVAAGNIITKLIGAQLCCMRGTQKTIELCQTNVHSSSST